MPNQPMAEVFGYKIDDFSPEAQRHRHHRLCPFNNKVPSCTKDKANDPLGVCSIYHGDAITITCPIRFRQDWLIATDAAEFFFPEGATWTSLVEIRLNDATGKSAGNIDVVLVSYNEEGQLLEFGALEVQAVYISGNVRKPFAFYMQDPAAHAQLDWRGTKDYPRADFLSSSRKRLAPQLIYKGGILHSWRRKMAVAVDSAFFAQLPDLPQIEPAAADVAWLVYDLRENAQTGRYHLARNQTVYTQFTPALLRITNPDPGPEEPFRQLLQRKLREKQRTATANLSSDTAALTEIFSNDQGLEVDED
jgi:hypothetical protein